MFNLRVYCNQWAVISLYRLSAALSSGQSDTDFCGFSTVIASHTGSEHLGKVLPLIIISDVMQGRTRCILLYSCSHQLMKRAMDIYRTDIVNSI